MYKILESLGAFAPGLCVGLVVGMSASPVVGAVAAALTAAMAAAFTARAGANAAEGAIIARRSVAVAAGFCVALVAGVWIRTHNLLSPTPTEAAESWQAAGYSPADARAIILAERLGANPPSTRASPAEWKRSLLDAGAAEADATALTLARAAREGAGDAASPASTPHTNLSQSAVFTDRKAPAGAEGPCRMDSNLGDWRDAGGEWAQAAAAIATLADEQRAALVSAVRAVGCR